MGSFAGGRFGSRRIQSREPREEIETRARARSWTLLSVWRKGRPERLGRQCRAQRVDARHAAISRLCNLDQVLLLVRGGSLRPTDLVRNSGALARRNEV